MSRKQNRPVHLIPKKKLDGPDEEILDHYRRHPHAKIADLAAKVHLTVSATSKRVTRLMHGRYLRRGMTVDLNKLGFRSRFRVDIKINPHDLIREIKKRKGTFRSTRLEHPDTKNAQKLLAHYLTDIVDRHHPNAVVEDVVILLGDPADLSAMIRLKDVAHAHQDGSEVAEGIFSLVTDVLRAIPGIENTSTCTQAWSCAKENDDKQARKDFHRKTITPARKRVGPNQAPSHESSSL